MHRSLGYKCWQSLMNFINKYNISVPFSLPSHFDSFGLQLAHYLTIWGKTKLETRERKLKNHMDSTHQVFVLNLFYTMSDGHRNKHGELHGFYTLKQVWSSYHYVILIYMISWYSLQPKIISLIYTYMLYRYKKQLTN